ncbi:MAG: cupredoxin domain-containing protein [Tepidiformaceae bacterium]
MPRFPFVRHSCAAVALGVILGAAACGGGGDSGPPANIPVGAPHIDQDDLAFEPNRLTVGSGEQVYFTNSETALHTVTIDGKKASGNMRKGDVFAWPAPAPGTYRITCDFHPQMKATVTVN